MRRALAVAVLAALVFPMAGARADSRAPRATNPAWKAECGSCHVAYPPGLLPAAAWRRVMGGLDRHFGADASLDAATAREIGAFLEQHASRRARAPADALEPRITETDWFVREHRKVEAAAWKRSSIKSAANCAACHTDAESGTYRERAIRIPR